MMRSSSHQAPYYIDIAHRAGLMYSFASLVVWKLVDISKLPPGFIWFAILSLIIFFWIATLTYFFLGLANKTDNQFSKRTFVTVYGMYSLIAFEIIGLVVLIVGIF